MPLRQLLRAALLLAALVAAGCGPVGPTPTVPPAATLTPGPTITPRGAAPTTVPVTPYAEGLAVTITAQGFEPAALAVALHSTVTWTNADSAEHRVLQGTPEAAAGFDSGSLAPGATFSFTFEKAGDYVYFCQLHPEQRGLVHVAP